LKKYIFYTGTILILISLLITWRIINNNTRKTRDLTKIERIKSGPEFKIEGRLHILHPQNPDTIKSIFIEYADTPDKISRGMMYRTSIKENEGMLFIFDAEQMQTFWMKNTRIPLDIIFINENFRIVHIAKHRIPYSTDPIPSIKPARYVLEVNAGFCNEHEIIENYRVQFVNNYR
jgi:uncharacterized membrane protein (UPF0127 family)